MPIYSFHDKDTDEIFDKMMKYEEKQQYLDENPNIVEVFLKAPGIIGGTGDGGRVPDHFKEVMSRVADQNPNTPVAERWGSKTSKQIKTAEAVNKARKKAGGSLMS